MSLTRTTGIVQMLVLVAAGLAAHGRADDWPCWRGPERSGISQEKGWFAPGQTPHVLWSVSVGEGYSGVAVADGRVYVMGHEKDQDVVSCLLAVDGTSVWRRAYACPAGGYPGPRTTPAIAGTRVVTMSREGHVLCMDRHDGTLLWQRNLKDEMRLTIPGWGLSGSPVIDRGRVYLNVGAHGLALDLENGKTLWDSGADPAGYATPVLAELKGVKALVIFGAKALQAVDLQTHAPLWSYPWETSYDVNAADPVVEGNSVFISSGYDRGCTLLNVEGAAPVKRWENKQLRSHFSSPVLWQGYLYGIDGNAGRGEVACLDFASGDRKWSSQGLGFGSLMLADGKLIVLNERGELAVVAADPAGCRELARGKILSGTCWTMAVLCGGRLYARNDRGTLVCVKFAAP